MGKSVRHPVLGTLTSPGEFDGWSGRVALPGFGGGRWPAELPLHFFGGERGPGDEPDPRAVALVLPLIEHAATLADVILDGLWAELDGREQENDHWWARPDGLAAVNQMLLAASERPIAGRDDLMRVLEPTDLFVRDDEHGDDAWTAGVGFACAFEEEHGLDVLTDGRRVLGTGYSLDAAKYARFWAITPAERQARHDANLVRLAELFKPTGG